MLIESSESFEGSPVSEREKEEEVKQKEKV
jgi:hypothetical protein